MIKYHEKISIESESMAANANADARTVPRYMSLAREYNLPDMTIGGPDPQEQTIEQEYQAYITARLSPQNVSILVFWEVGGSY